MVVILADKCEECINRMMTTAANQHSVFLVELELFIDLLDKITGWPPGPGPAPEMFIEIRVIILASTERDRVTLTCSLSPPLLSSDCPTVSNWWNFESFQNCPVAYKARL